MKTAFIVLLLALLQTSCNTFIGVARDLQQLGTGMENVGQKQW
jgi:predicted small secreted protein